MTREKNRAFNKCRGNRN